MAITVGVAADPTTSGARTGTVVTEEVDDMLTGLWNHMQTEEGSNTVGTVTTDSEAERDSFRNQARLWASQHNLRFRAVRNSETDNGLMFRLTIPLTAEQKAQIETDKEARRVARAKAGKAAPGRKRK